MLIINYKKTRFFLKKNKSTLTFDVFKKINQYFLCDIMKRSKTNKSSSSKVTDLNALTRPKYTPSNHVVEV